MTGRDRKPRSRTPFAEAPFDLDRAYVQVLVRLPDGRHVIGTLVTVLTQAGPTVSLSPTAAATATRRGRRLNLVLEVGQWADAGRSDADAVQELITRGDLPSLVDPDADIANRIRTLKRWQADYRRLTQRLPADQSNGHS